MNADALLVFVTFPTREIARQIAQTLVEEKLVACANLGLAVESIYWWKGAAETAEETLVLFKTTAEGFGALEARVRTLHPYEVPEIIGIPIEKGSADYLAWIAESVAAPP